MLILGEDEIGDFCAAGTEDRKDLLAALAAEKHRPAGLLPWFALCDYLYSRARLGRLDVATFRTCWSALVSGHFQNASDGFLVHLDDGAPDDDELLKAVYALSRPPRREQDRRGDPRDRNQDWKEEVLRGRFRELHQRAIPALDARARDEVHWCWNCTPPEALLACEHHARPGSTDTVLDTNVLVELLNAFPLEDQPGSSPILSKLAEPFQRLLPALSDGFGKLIVPVSVLIETEGVIAAKVEHYRRADTVLRDMAVQPQHTRFAAFVFEPMDDETFGAFLHLVERLAQTGVSLEDWPTLGDALVLAHGISNGCPVASYEWLHKDEWHRTQLLEAFPYLYPGSAG